MSLRHASVLRLTHQTNPRFKGDSDDSGDSEPRPASLYTVIASPVTRTQSQLETQVTQTLGKTSHLPRKLCLSHRSLTCCKCKECSFP